MATYNIHIGADIRGYGYVTIEADSLDEAAEKATELTRDELLTDYDFYPNQDLNTDFPLNIGILSVEHSSDQDEFANIDHELQDTLADTSHATLAVEAVRELLALIPAGMGRASTVYKELRDELAEYDEKYKRRDTTKSISTN